MVDPAPTSPTSPPTSEITRRDIEDAAARIAGHVRRTPVLEVDPTSLGLPAFGRLVLKLDLFQPSGSFKARGACNFLLASHVPEAGVAGASGGNFGLALAWAAQRFGHPATIFVTEATAPVKVERLRTYGAKVVVSPGFYADALAASIEFAAATGALLGHAYDHELVVAGAGTCGREIDEDVPDVDTVIVAVGGAGLAGGVASWFRDAARVVGVEPVAAPSLHAALAAGHPVDVDVGGIAADSLGARRAGAIGVEAASRWGVRSVLVDDDDIVEAQRRLWHGARLASEPGAAAALAALCTGAYMPDAGERVCVVVCGGNVDPATLA
jgi:threonine dehydratase